jgi:hypothetical protein
MSHRWSLLAFGAALCSAMLASSRTVEADPPVLAELFTSQGCSSCPPADELLGALARRPDILALSFHVDYWDGPSWSDPFALGLATVRQRHYAEILRAQVYTPQIVIEGRTETVGSDPRRVAALLQQSRPAPVIATVRPFNGKLAVHVDGSSRVAANLEADILLVTFDPMHQTPIHGGENGGRYLATYNDVRSLRTIGRWQGEAISVDVPREPGDIGTRAAIIVQSSDGVIWALAATNLDTVD